MGMGGDDDRHRQSGEHPDNKAIDHEHSFMEWLHGRRSTFSSGTTVGLSMKIVSHILTQKKAGQGLRS